MGEGEPTSLVSVGLGINLLILGVLTLGAFAPPVPEAVMPPWQVLQLSEPVALPNGTVVESEVGLFPTDLCHHIGRCFCLDDGLRGSAILRCATLPFLETSNPRQASLAEEQLAAP